MFNQNRNVLQKVQFSRKYKNILLPLLISFVSFCAYLNTLHNQFVFDDFRIIVDNPFLKEWKCFFSLFKGNYFEITGELSYRPLVSLTYFIDYRIWGLNPFGFHLTNITIHTFNVFLVHFVIKKTTSNLGLSFISSLLFGIHPVLTEAINSVGFREDLLCATFFLLTLFCYINIDASRYEKIWIVVALLAYVFSLLAKEMAITLPLIILLLDWLKNKVTAGRIKYYTGFILISGIYLLFRLKIFKSSTEYFVYPENSLTTNILTMAKVIASYIKLWFFPVFMNPDYHVIPEDSVLSLSFFLSLVLLSSAGIITGKLFRREKSLVFFILWIVITLIPVLNIIPIGNIMAERYLYIPSVGFCACVGITFLKIYDRFSENSRIIPGICFFLILSFCLVFTIQQNRIWFDKETLWPYIVQNRACSFNAHNNMGTIYFQKGMVDKAIEEYNIAFSKASEVNHEFSEPHAKAHYNLGLAYGKKGQYEASIREFEMTLRINSKDSEAHNNLGIMYFQCGKTERSLSELKKAISLDKENPMYHENLARVYNQIGMPDKAREEQEKARSLRRINTSP